MTKKAILFDCDGVLINSEKIYISIDRELLSNMGLNYGLEEFQSRFVGLQFSDYIRELEDDYNALNKGLFPENFEDSVNEEAWKRFATELVAVDGLLDLLNQIEGTMDVAVASSSTIPELHKKLKLTDLHHRFDPHLYSGQHVTNGKPAPDLFLYAAKQLGQSPEHCIVIEDSVNGVRTGRDAGMTVWGFTGGGHGDDNLASRLTKAGADQVFSSFDEISARLSA